ncbi:MAG: fluoride efflux transporter CrcB [Proteobacteria bacterium]|nr:MAG: fluoride efflux transporter CrcB [Pseudomonadota bacterium]PIE37079.1 MAG: fluoride efflux transporter CrcB [Gammaproteobacteria bacterium]
MINMLVIAIGGALGAIARYSLVGWISEWLGKSYPYGTWLVNILGSFLIGVAYIFVIEKFHATPEIRSLAMVGFLGAFTTFSTFSLETVSLLQNGRVITAVLYVSSSVTLCVMATAAGMMLAKPLVNQFFCS